MKCPDFSEILDVAEGKSDSRTENEVQTHLKTGCTKCVGSLDWALKTLSVVKSERLFDAPEYVIRRSLDIFPAQKPSAIQWIQARLEFDSALMQPAGLRSSTKGERQWIYTTESHRIVLMVQGPARNPTLSGQLIAIKPSDGAQTCEVEIGNKRGTIASQTSSHEGEFQFEGIPKKFFLRIRTLGKAILIPISY
jgi:hypothetical protein